MKLPANEKYTKPPLHLRFYEDRPEVEVYTVNDTGLENKVATFYAVKDREALYNALLFANAAHMLDAAQNVVSEITKARVPESLWVGVAFAVEVLKREVRHSKDYIP